MISTSARSRQRLRVHGTVSFCLFWLSRIDRPRQVEFDRMERQRTSSSQSRVGRPDVLSVPSARFGTIAVPRELVLSFPLGIAGFEDATTFALVEIRAGLRFRWLQSLEHPDLGFVVVEAATIVNGYPLDQVRKGLEFCEIEHGEHVVALAICRVPNEPDEPTVNLQAPLGIALRSRRGAQVLLRESGMTMAMPLRV